MVTARSDPFRQCVSFRISLRSETPACTSFYSNQRVSVRHQSATVASGHMSSLLHTPAGSRTIVFRLSGTLTVHIARRKPHDAKRQLTPCQLLMSELQSLSTPQTHYACHVRRSFSGINRGAIRKTPRKVLGKKPHVQQKTPLSASCSRTYRNSIQPTFAAEENFL